MRSRTRYLKMIAGFVCLVALIYAVSGPGWPVVEWVAWHWIRVDFVATCRIRNFDKDRSSNTFKFVWGPYSNEFNRDVLDQMRERYPNMDIMTKTDGRVTVPLGFYLPYDPFVGRFDGDPEIEGRGFGVSSGAAYTILQRRVAEGVDISSYDRYKEWIYPWQSKTSPPELYAGVCGVIDELIQKDGALVKP